MGQKTELGDKIDLNFHVGYSFGYWTILNCDSIDFFDIFALHLQKFSYLLFGKIQDLLGG